MTHSNPLANVYDDDASTLQIGEYTLLELACSCLSRIVNAETAEAKMEAVLWYARYIYVVGCGDGRAEQLRSFESFVGRLSPEAGLPGIENQLKGLEEGQ